MNNYIWKKLILDQMFRFVREQFVKNSAITLELQLVQKYLESAKEKITLLETENEKLKKELENCKANMYPQLRNSAEDWITLCIELMFML